MSTRHSSGEIRLDVTAGREQVQARPDPETPFRVAILGDFSGRANRGLLETGDALASRRPIMVDRDNFDSVLAKLAPRLDLTPGGEDDLCIPLKFSDLDDFHPDKLFEQVKIFQKLRETRRKLGDSATFAQTAAELTSAAAPSDAPPPQAAPAQVQGPAPSPRASAQDIQSLVSGSFLDEMVEETESKAQQDQSAKRPDEWSRLLHKLVSPHLVAKADPRQAELIAVIDRATSAQMGALLHAPAFQALEAAWRAVYFLVRNVETDIHLKLFLIDVSKQELAQDLLTSGDLRSTGMYRLLVERTVGTPGADPWAVIAGDFTFGPSLQDSELLARIGKVAASAGAPFIAGASPRLLGCDSAVGLPEVREWKLAMSGESAASWQRLRSSAEARFVGLSLPRFLLRLPYGKDTEPIERFQFEEMPDPGAHENYLWGNAAFAAVLLLAQSFAEHGWDLQPGAHSEIDGLPVYIYKSKGETETLPCAETPLTQTAAEEMMERGFMPLASLKDQPAVRLVRFQSIADPMSALAGRWES